MWLVMRLQNFEFEPEPGQLFNIPIKINTGKMIGFAPVYESLEDAKADFPNADYQEIRLKNNLREGI